MVLVGRFIYLLDKPRLTVSPCIILNIQLYQSSHLIHGVKVNKFQNVKRVS